VTFCSQVSFLIFVIHLWRSESVAAELQLLSSPGWNVNVQEVWNNNRQENTEVQRIRLSQCTIVSIISHTYCPALFCNRVTGVRSHRLTAWRQDFGAYLRLGWTCCLCCFVQKTNDTLHLKFTLCLNYHFRPAATQRCVRVEVKFHVNRLSCKFKQ
jgi:hypothetical protein